MLPMMISCIDWSNMVQHFLPTSFSCTDGSQCFLSQFRRHCLCRLISLFRGIQSSVHALVDRLFGRFRHHLSVTSEPMDLAAFLSAFFCFL
jgi:hypothetical protein